MRSFEKFSEAMEDVLISGEWTVRRVARSPEAKTPQEAADAMAEHFDFQPIGDRWEVVTPEQAREILLFNLMNELEYIGTQLKEGEAIRAANEFFAFFKHGSLSCLTNAKASATHDYARSAISDEQYEVAVVLMDDRYVGVFLFAD